VLRNLLGAHGGSGSFRDQQKFGFLAGAIDCQRMLVIFVERECD
jgi:hypothetical protein